MNTSNKIRKTISKMLLPFALAGAMAVMPPRAHAEEVKKPTLELRLDNKACTDPATGNMVTDKLRTTLTYGDLSLRLDKNNGRQSQYLFQWKPVNNANTKVNLLHQGDIAENIDGNFFSQSYAFGGSLQQNIGRIPLFGKASLRLLQINSLKTDDKPINKQSITLFGEHLDLAYQLIIDRQRIADPQYFVAYHDDKLHVALGKTKGNVIEGVLFTKNLPGLGIMAWGNYNLDTKTLSVSSWNSYKNGVQEGVYDQPTARYVSDLMILTTMPVNAPILPSYLTDGDITHKLELKVSPDKFEMENQLGVIVTKNFGVGAGLLVKREAGRKAELSPVVESYIKIPITDKLSLYIDGNYRDGKMACLATTRLKF